MKYLRLCSTNLCFSSNFVPAQEYGNSGSSNLYQQSHANTLKKKTITRNCTQDSLAWVFLPFVHVVTFQFVSCVLLLVLSCFLCNCCWLTLCIVVVVLCVLLSYVYLLYYVFIAVFTLDAGLLARSQYSEGPATGHLDTGFSWFPCA